MRESTHAKLDNLERRMLISEIGLGEILHTSIVYDEKRKKEYRYEITSTAMLIVKAIDADLIITKIVARPSRIRKYWNEAPKAIIDLAIEHARKGYTF